MAKITPKKLIIKKENGRLQRSDVALTKEVATALCQLIFSGKSLYPADSKYITLEIEGKERKLSKKTLNTWVSRDNVIPETGKTLKVLLNEAREEYRSTQDEKRRRIMGREIESQFHRTLRLKTNKPVIGMFGKMKDPKTGKFITAEDEKLLKIKMDTAKFLAERLMPKVYGKVEKTENKHLVFSLADLRKERRKEEEKEIFEETNKE